MIIQHNIPAINAHRQLGVNNTSLSKNLEKLSSGYRINRAADDAAGLAISEKMRAQITGLNRAVLNAQDGASLIQSAEGALTEVHSMLNRMTELATESANGTFKADDRQKIESELTALKGEIDRISKATNFNGIQLLDGSLAGGAKEINPEGIANTVTAAVAGVYTLTTGTATGTVAGDAGNKFTYTVASDDGTSYNFEFTIGVGATSVIGKSGTAYTTTSTPTGAELSTALAGEMAKDTAFTSKFTVAHATNAAAITLTSKAAGTAGPKVVAGKITSASTIMGAVTSVVANPTASADKSVAIAQVALAAKYHTAGEDLNANLITINGQKFAVAVDAAALAEIHKLDSSVTAVVEGASAAATNEALALAIKEKTGLNVAGTATSLTITAGTNGKGLTMQVGDTDADFNKITVNVDDMSSQGLGIEEISFATQESSGASMAKIASAIEKVSVNRGNLGALQNRLEHTISNLNVTSENMTAAESRVRDVDMAKEMMNFTKNNVLSQAAQAMLAQANQQPQQVLQLLR